MRKIGELTIMVVEDQEETRSMLRTMLDELGVGRIVEAADGKAALGLIESGKSPANVVLCDWNMPQMSGLELLRIVRRGHPKMPFLMITGRSDLESVVEAKSSGVTAYLLKPFSPQQLEAKLRIIIHMTGN